MTPEALAALHAAAFTDTPRPWSATEFTGLLADPGVIFVKEPDGFAFGQVAGPEAEILTLAVAPNARRRGVATRLVKALCAAAAAAGAGEMLLEVAVTNAGARALYASLGFLEVGRRPRYYTRPVGPAVDALVLRREIAT